MLRNVVVVGGTGFIGEYVVKELKRAGASVKIARAPIKAADVKKADCVVWLAPVSKGLLEKSVSTLRTAPLKRFVYASSLLVYPASTTPQKEETAVRPLTVYEKSKLREEVLLQKTFSKRQEALVITRLANVYGDIKNSGIVGKIITAALTGKPLTVNGDGTQRRDYIHVEEVAKILGKIATTKTVKVRVLNICTGVSHSLNEIIKRVEKLSRKQVNTTHRKGPKEKKSVVGNNRKLRALFKVQIGTNIDAGLQKTIRRYEASPRSKLRGIRAGLQARSRLRRRRKISSPSVLRRSHKTFGNIPDRTAL